MLEVDKPLLEKYSYSPGNLFELSPEELSTYERLSQHDQVIFMVYRESFILSMAHFGTQGHVLSCLLNWYFTPDLKQHVLAMNETPSYLKVIGAPKRNHPGRGQISTDPENERVRLGTIESAWETWKQSFRIPAGNSQPKDDKPAPAKEEEVVRALRNFIQMDFKYVKGTEVYSGKNYQRFTGNDKHASFVRELVLVRPDQYASGIRVSSYTAQLLADWRAIINQIHSQPLPSMVVDNKDRIKLSLIELQDAWNENHPTVSDPFFPASFSE